MTIAVYIPSYETSPFNHEYATEIFTRLATKNPDEHFIFFVAAILEKGPVLPANVTQVIVKPAIRNGLLQHFIYNFKLPRLLNRYIADWFVSFHVCSLRAKQQQLLICPDLDFLNADKSASLLEAGYLKKFFPSFLKRAAKIVVLNSSLNSVLGDKFFISRDKIVEGGYAFKPVATNSSLSDALIKDELTDGNEFFLAFVDEASETHLLMILKAFSIFKKWQKSSWKLVIAFDNSVTKKVVPALATFKFRGDVKVMHADIDSGNTEIFTQAYAVIYLSKQERVPLILPKLISAETALIVNLSKFNSALYKDSVLYTAIEEKVMADKLMLLYKDENFRKDLIKKLRKIRALLTYDHAATAFEHILNMGVPDQRLPLPKADHE